MGLGKSRHKSRTEHQVMDATAKIGPHHALAFGGRENDIDGLLDILFIACGLHRAVRQHGERKRPSDAEEFLACRVLVHGSLHPISTVGSPMAIGSGGPASTI